MGGGGGDGAGAGVVDGAVDGAGVGCVAGDAVFGDVSSVLLHPAASTSAPAQVATR
jgi:hypothetical protein